MLCCTVLVGGDDIVVLQYNSDGLLQWTYQTGSSGYDYGYGLTLSGDYVYVTGNVGGTINGQAFAGERDA